MRSTINKLAPKTREFVPFNDTQFVEISTPQTGEISLRLVDECGATPIASLKNFKWSFPDEVGKRIFLEIVTGANSTALPNPKPILPRKARFLGRKVSKLMQKMNSFASSSDFQIQTECMRRKINIRVHKITKALTFTS